MKRVAIFLAVVTGLLLLILTAIASAAPPDCDDRPDHPRCSTTTTTTTEPPITKPCPTGPIALSVSGQQGFECDWTPEVSSEGMGTVTVETIEGEVTRLVVFVRDSSPGDICVLNEWDKPIGSPVVSSFTLGIDSEPAVAGFEENYWDSPIHWCERFDPIAGQREDFNGEPLHLRVNLRGKPGTQIEISLFPGQAH